MKGIGNQIFIDIHLFYHPIFVTHIDIHAVRLTFLVNLKDGDNKVHYREINGQGPVELTLMIII